MTSTERRIAALEARLEQGERQARQWRSAALGCAVTLGLFLSLGAARQDPIEEQVEEPEVTRMEHVIAHRLDVVDGSGNILVRIGSDPQGRGEVAVIGDAELPVAVLGASNDGHGATGVFSRDGDPIGFLAADDRGDGAVWVSWSNGQQVNYVGADLRGNSRLPENAKAGRRL